MFDLTFEVGPAWFAQQLALARSGLRARGVRIDKTRDWVVAGYVDCVLILSFPHFEVSTACEGEGERWFSVNPHLLDKALSTSSSMVQVTVKPATIRLGRFEQSHAGMQLRLGWDDADWLGLEDSIEARR